GFESDFFSSSGITKTTFDFGMSYADNSRSKVGDALYLTNGLTLEIDRRQPHENGFLINPDIDVEQVTGSANANVASKTFSYCAIYEYVDSQGQITRSAPSLTQTITTDSSASGIEVSYKALASSLK